MIDDSEAAYVAKVQNERSAARGEAWRLKALFDEVKRVLDGPGSADDKVARLREKLD